MKDRREISHITIKRLFMPEIRRLPYMRTSDWLSSAVAPQRPHKAIHYRTRITTLKPRIACLFDNYWSIALSYRAIWDTYNRSMKQKISL